MAWVSIHNRPAGASMQDVGRPDTVGLSGCGSGLDAVDSWRTVWRHVQTASTAAAIVTAAVIQGAFGTAGGAEPLQLGSTHQVEAAPEQDDAALHDVTFASGDVVWAVGDRGTCWKSADGGGTWQFVAVSPEAVACTLESVSFLTDRVGWIAGGRIVPVARSSAGFLWHTVDGGATWQAVDTGALPYLRYVRFFNLDRGVVMGEATSRNPSGVWVTEDGGSHWSAVSASKRAQWTAAAFLAPGAGIVVGPRGARGAVNDRELLLALGTGGLRGLNGVSIDREGRGWVVGDGGALLRTINGGASWVLAEGELPQEVNHFCELKGVWHEENQVWCCGTPGSVVWHSADAGRTWEGQATPDPAPLHAIRFADARRGCAVGAFGRIVVTQDGGRTWKSVRGAGRRLALLAVHTSLARLPHQLLARHAWEEGYRAALSVVARRDIGPDAHAHWNAALQLSQMVVLEGGIASEVGWRLPVAIPGLEREKEHLLREWMLLTEGRLGEVVLEHLVARLRTWRPDVVIIDEAGKDDFVAEVVERGVLEAVRRAGDPTALPQHREYGLAPWSVKKVLGRRPEGATGTIRLDPYQILPRRGETLDQAVLRGAACVSAAGDVLSPEQYVLLYAHSGQEGSERTILGDIGIPLGSDARRSLPPAHGDRVEELLRQAQQRKTVTALGESMLQRPEAAGSLLAQLKELVAPLGRAQAAQQLADVARGHRRRGQIDLAEETYLLLLSEYGDQPAALEAMLWLINQWTSIEVNWQRLRSMRGAKEEVRTSAEILRANWQEAVDLIRHAETETARDVALSQLKSPVQSANRPVTLLRGDFRAALGHGKAVDQRTQRLAGWQEMAQLTLDHVVAQRPELWAVPDVQFAYAALMRRRARARRADEIYDRFLSQISDDPWHLAARGETWLLRPGPVSPKPVLACRTASQPPILDGLLSDPCWSTAAEMKLSAQGDDTVETYVGTRKDGLSRRAAVGPQAIAMLCYDERYLYVAASMPRHAAARSDRPEYAGRVHDADLRRYDRIVFHFDVDRDYNTYYTFAVDQRGWTSESCWEDSLYNPQWYVAADADERYWRIEAAIPLEELVPASLKGQTWGLGVSRIIPGVGWETWTDAGAENPQPARFGLVQFLR